MLDAPIEVAHLTESLIPESEQDEARLKELGSFLSLMKFHARISLHVARFQNLDTATLSKLLSREIGLALYSDALRLSTPIGRFRELWRLLESAFGQKDSDLLVSLASYPPAVDLEYDREELTALHILRGRASHAESSAGLDEYHNVSRRVENLLPRLQCLAEEVVSTKKTWGSRGLGVARAQRRPEPMSTRTEFLCCSNHRAGISPATIFFQVDIESKMSAD